jgi:hypothetical protein
MEGFSFVTPVTGLIKPNTGKEEEEDDDDDLNCSECKNLTFSACQSLTKPYYVTKFHYRLITKLRTLPRNWDVSLSLQHGIILRSSGFLCTSDFWLSTDVSREHVVSISELKSEDGCSVVLQNIRKQTEEHCTEQQRRRTQD